MSQNLLSLKTTVCILHTVLKHHKTERLALPAVTAQMEVLRAECGCMGCYSSQMKTNESERAARSEQWIHEQLWGFSLKVGTDTIYVG